jgi:hypothetical protein
MYSSYSFSTSALDGSEWPASRPVRALAPGERTAGTHCTGGWVGPRTGLDIEARGKILLPLPEIESRSLGPSARSQTLYWLSYPAHKLTYSLNVKQVCFKNTKAISNQFVSASVEQRKLCNADILNLDSIKNVYPVRISTRLPAVNCRLKYLFVLHLSFFLRRSLNFFIP